MTQRLWHVLGIRHGEGARTARLFGLILLLTLTVALAKAAQQGIFLASAPRDRIADAFVLSAVVLALASFGVSALAGRLDPVRLFVRLSVAVAALFGAGWSLFCWRQDALALYVLVEASIGVVVVQGWSVATEALDVRSAKRLLPLVGNAAGLGWTIGGFLAGPLGHALGAAALVPIAAGLLVGAGLLAAWVGRVDIVHARSATGKATLWDSLGSGWRQLGAEPLLRTLAVLATVGLLTEQLLDYVLFATAQAELQTKERIAAFMGAFFGVTGAVSLLAPLVAGRILARLGSSATAQVPPGAALVFGLGLAAHPSFAAAVLARGAFRVTESSLGSAARGQMQTALPGAARAQGNALVKGVIAPAFYALGGLALKAAPGVDLHVLALAAVALGGAGYYVAGVVLRRAYAGLLRKTVDHRTLNLDDVHRLDDEEVQLWSNELYCGDRTREIVAAEILAQCTASPKARAALLGVCALPDAELQRHALGALCRTARPSDMGALCTALRHAADPELRRTALRGLLHVSGSWQIAVRNANDDAAVDVRALRLVGQVLQTCKAAPACAGQGCDRPCGAALAELRAMAADPDPQLRATALWAIGALHAGVEGTLGLALQGTTDPDPAVYATALTTLAALPHSQALAAVFAALDHRTRAHCAVDALAVVPDGQLHATASIVSGLSARGQAAAAVAFGMASGPHSATLLAHLLASDQRFVRYRAAKAMAARQRHHTLGRMPVAAVQAAAEAEIRSALQAMLVLAGIAHRNRDRVPTEGGLGLFCGEVAARIALCQRRMATHLALLCDPRLVELVWQHTRRGDPKRLAAALELLEGALPETLREDVLLVLDGQSLRERYRVLRLRPDLDQSAATDPLQCVMGPAGDDWLRTCAVVAFGETMARTHPEHFAASSRQVPLLQRVQFLRAVSLFDAVAGEDLLQIASTASELSLGSDATVFSKGDPSQDIYLVVRGSVVLVDGGAPIATVRPPEVFGELAALDGEPRSASAVCAEATTLLRIARADLDEIMERKPQVAREIIRVLARRLRNSTARLVQASGVWKA